MSRIGKKPILIPDGVGVVKESGKIIVRGPKGELSFFVRDDISFEIKDNIVQIHPASSSKDAPRLWGTYAAHFKNALKGVKDGFEKKLTIEGIGYRAQMQGDKLILNLGFSHPIEFKPEEEIKINVEKNSIIISGINKEKVGQAAAHIRSFKKPEPYKGKGIRYEDEIIRRKAGKKAGATA